MAVRRSRLWKRRERVFPPRGFFPPPVFPRKARAGRRGCCSPPRARKSGRVLCRALRKNPAPRALPRALPRCPPLRRRRPPRCPAWKARGAEQDWDRCVRPCRRPQAEFFHISPFAGGRGGSAPPPRSHSMRKTIFSLHFADSYANIYLAISFTPNCVRI